MSAAPTESAGARAGLDTRLGSVVGGRTAAALEKAFGHRTIGDLLAHYPRRYARRGELTALAGLPVGEDVTIVADVLSVTTRPMRQKRGTILEVAISDGTGALALTFFNQAWRADELRPGVRGIFAGKVTEYRGSRQLTHPAYELFPGEGTAADAERWAHTPIPIYPATGSLQSWKLQKVIALALDALEPPDDPVPAEVASRHGLIAFAQALEAVHRPERDSEARAARRALRFHEAFVLEAELLRRRADARAERATPREPAPGGCLERFDAALPFALTDDQRDVGAEIARDLASSSPMSRLVQGEVGSGKTLVALRAMLAVADSGGQSAMIAPTEVLAAQHLRSITAALGPDLSAELMPTLVIGQLSAPERRRALLRIVAGQARIVLGTHALLGDAVEFFDLGLVVVDEQHRFGVDQREALRRKGTAPHVLVLTATPIPRTVAMTVFGDLDISTVATLPPGRAGIDSHVVALADTPGWWGRVWQRAAEEIRDGRQVYVVCPAIDSSDATEDGGPPPASVEDTMAHLAAHPELGSSRLAAVTGRMAAEEKDAVMTAFASGDTDLLVATTVIEVGVDVPNASTMVILDADRFGVSQLHQLRGRVGRGEHRGLCLLVTRAPRGTLGRDRVEAVAATSDGFRLAQADLELRREGDVLGSAQSGGRSSLRLLRAAHDADVIADARADAAAVLDADPTLADHPALRDAIERRLGEESAAYLARA